MNCNNDKPTKFFYSIRVDNVSANRSRHFYVDVEVTEYGGVTD